MALIGRGFRNVRMALSPRPAGLSPWPASRAGAPSLPRGVSSCPPSAPCPLSPGDAGGPPSAPADALRPLPGRPTPPSTWPSPLRGCIPSQGGGFPAGPSPGVPPPTSTPSSSGSPCLRSSDFRVPVALNLLPRFASLRGVSGAAARPGRQPRLSFHTPQGLQGGPTLRGGCGVSWRSAAARPRPCVVARLVVVRAVERTSSSDSEGSRRRRDAVSWRSREQRKRAGARCTGTTRSGDRLSSLNSGSCGARLGRKCLAQFDQDGIGCAPIRYNAGYSESLDVTKL